jgi:hypothetical protein
MTDLELGVLAEDQNDCDVIDVLCRRILLGGGIGPNAWRLRRRAGKGCAKLRRKAAGWLAELAQQGCRAAIIVHDLDRNPLNGSLNELAVLERELNVIPVPHGLIRHICIPVEEIEAWFFSSERVLERVCGKTHRAHPSPDRIARPKEKLIDLSRGANRKPRYSQNDNSKLAEDLDLAECAKRCPAFEVLNRFVLGLFSARQS